MPAANNCHLDFESTDAFDLGDEIFSGVRFERLLDLVEDAAALERRLRDAAVVAADADVGVLEALGVDGDDDGAAQAEVVLQREVDLRNLPLLGQASQLKALRSKYFIM